MKASRFGILVASLVLTACPEPPKPPEKPTPPVEEEPPPTKPTPPPTTKKEPEKPKSGTHATIAERKNNNDSWDKMVATGGKLFVMTNVNKWTTGQMYVPGARLWSTPTTGGDLVKLMDLEGSASLAADDASVYVAVNRDLSLTGTPKQNTPSGRIFKLPVAGGSPTDLVKGIEPRVMGIDGDTLWFDAMKMPKDGSKPPAPSGVKAPMTLAFDAEYVYFTQGKGSGEPIKGDKNGRILRMKKTGGAPTVLAKDLPDEPSGLALDGTHVYASAVTWTSAAEKSGVVVRVAKEGGNVEVLAKDVPQVRGAWLGGEHVYVVSGRWGRPCNVLKIPKAGGTPETAVSDSTLEHATADDTSIYFSSDGKFREQPFERLSDPFLVRYVR